MPLRLVLFMVLYDFLNDEIQKFLSKLGVEIGLGCKGFKPRDLTRFAVWIGRGKIVFGL